MEQTSLRVGPKDVFLHLLAIATLYASAISFGVLLFNYIDLFFPETLRDAFYYVEGLRNAIRFSVSTLIVVFPVYFFTTRFLRKSYEAEPERKNMAIRKWLSYFTVFLAAVIGIGWLVAVVNKFLEGDFTTAFLLKALTIFFVTGSIFYYYLSVTKGTETRPTVKYYGYFVSVIVAAAIIAAFFAVGSPTRQRDMREDSRRLGDLQAIQNYIGEYYRNKGKLPAKLSDLNDSFRGVNVPEDPATKKEYEYSTKGADSFSLCAEFKLAWDPDSAAQDGRSVAMPSYPEMYYGMSGRDWKHEAGRHCFDRTIDKDFLNPTKPIPAAID